MDDANTVADPITQSPALKSPQTVLLSEQLEEISTAVAPLQGKVSKNPKTAAVILAGGSGERFGNPGGKQLFELLGKPVLTWSSEAFDAVADVGLIVIVCPEDRIEEYCRVAIDPYPFVTPIEFTASGELRQESSFAGVMKVPSSYDLIAIHDGARPLVTPELIMHAISAVKGNGDIDGSVVGHPAVDTLKVVDNGTIVGTPDRAAFWVAQTPQVFRSDIIRLAHTTALGEGFIGTDDSSIVERIGGTVALVQGPRDNIKVTVPEDFGPAEAALVARLIQRNKI
ncbi:MAG: 2-C-methyl-D-erythritol 4-phosphate cytidylyltransferase [Coriobacteriales bacterium]